MAKKKLVEFKVGDRVRAKVLQSYDRGSCWSLKVRGAIGVVRVIDKGEPPIGVEFDRDVCGHGGRDHFRGMQGHCWYFYAKELVKLPKRGVRKGGRV